MDDPHRLVAAMKGLGAVLLMLPLLSACGPDATPQPKVCDTHTASLTLAAPEVTLTVEEPVTVMATLSNDGCGMLGLPIYRLQVEADQGGPGLEPVDPEPVSHSLGISAGEVDRAEFSLRAVGPGEVHLRASVSYEVHLDSASGAYWGVSGTMEPLTITVVP